MSQPSAEMVKAWRDDKGEEFDGTHGNVVKVQRMQWVSTFEVAITVEKGRSGIGWTEALDAATAREIAATLVRFADEADAMTAAAKGSPDPTDALAAERAKGQS